MNSYSTACCVILALFIFMTTHGVHASNSFVNNFTSTSDKSEPDYSDQDDDESDKKKTKKSRFRFAQWPQWVNWMFSTEKWKPILKVIQKVYDSLLEASNSESGLAQFDWQRIDAHAKHDIRQYRPVNR